MLEKPTVSRLLNFPCSKYWSDGACFFTAMAADVAAFKESNVRMHTHIHHWHKSWRENLRHHRCSTKSDDKNWLTDGQLLSHICAFTIALLCLSVSQSHISSTSRMSLCAPTFCCYVNLIIAVSSATTWSISRYEYIYHKVNIESFQVHQRLRKLHNSSSLYVSS